MQKLISIIFLLCISPGIYSQTNSPVGKLIHERKSAIEAQSKAPKYLQKADLLSLDPFTIGALLCLQAYKSALSSDLGSQCRFSPSCSAFSAQIIKHSGVWTGVLLTADRLIKCNPEAEFDHCEHLIDRETGIINDEVTDY